MANPQLSPGQQRAKLLDEGRNKFANWTDDEVSAALKAFGSRTRTRLYTVAIAELERRGHTVDGTWVHRKKDEPAPVPQVEMVELLSEGTKADEGKVPFDLLSPDFLDGVSRVLAFGAQRYAPYNWALGIKYSRVYAALQRHLWAFWGGEDNDEETGMPHLWHAGCCLMFLTHYEMNDYEEFNDKPNYQRTETSGSTQEELRRARRLGGEDSESVVTPESRDAHRVQGTHFDRTSEAGLAGGIS